MWRQGPGGVSAAEAGLSLLHSAGGSAPRILISCPCMQLLRRPFRGSRRLLWGADRLGVCCEAGSGRPDCRLCTGPTLGREILRGPGPGGGPFLLSPPKIVFVWLLVSSLCRAVRSIGSPASSHLLSTPISNFSTFLSSPTLLPSHHSFTTASPKDDIHPHLSTYLPPQIRIPRRLTAHPPHTRPSAWYTRPPPVASVRRHFPPRTLGPIPRP